MRKVLLILLTISSILWTERAQAQTSRQQKIDRRIYIWDVTKSMQGHNSKTNDYDASIDVWDKVVDFLKKDIEAITDSSTELIMLPFQEEILDEWSVKATEDGKKQLLQKIDDAKSRFTDKTYTNISGPFEVAKRKFVSPNKNNLIILLTDGQQSKSYGGQDKWIALLDSWQDYAKQNNAYLIYFMVTEAAEDARITDKIKNKPSSDVVMPSSVIPEFIDIYPETLLNFNIKDDHKSGLRIPLNKSKKGTELAAGIKIAIKTAENAALRINTVAEIKDNMLHIYPEYNFEELKATLGQKEVCEVPLTFELLNQDEIKENKHQMIFLKSNNATLRLINKLEKVLKISIKR